MIITADHVLTPEAMLAPGWVRVTGETIDAVGSGSPAPEPGEPRRDLGDVVLAPGFVDMHVHGGGGASFTTGDPEQAAQVVAAHRRRGTTAMMASLVTDGPAVLREHVRELAPLVRSGELLGIHLEGPCLSPLHRGAHDPDLLAPPTPAVLDSVLEAGEGGVRMVTIAVELDGGLDAVRRVVDAGVIAALGHTDATYDTALAAIDAGVSVATHLCNAMRPLNHREPGPILALLRDPHVTLELISDGVHVHPAVVSAVFAAGGPRVALITDAMSAAAQGDGDYTLGPLAVTVRGGVARLATTRAIAGSTLTLEAAVRYAVTHAGVDLETALRAASEVPAARLARTDIGAVRAGARADLVAVTADAELAAVMSRGRWLEV